MPDTWREAFLGPWGLAMLYTLAIIWFRFNVDGRLREASLKSLQVSLLIGRLELLGVKVEPDPKNPIGYLKFTYSPEAQALQTKVEYGLLGRPDPEMEALDGLEEAIHDLADVAGVQLDEAKARQRQEWLTNPNYPRRYG